MLITRHLKVDVYGLLVGGGGGERETKTCPKKLEQILRVYWTLVKHRSGIFCSHYQVPTHAYAIEKLLGKTFWKKQFFLSLWCNWGTWFKLHVQLPKFEFHKGTFEGFADLLSWTWKWPLSNTWGTVSILICLSWAKLYVPYFFAIL